jgi:hypothetical protein
VGKSAKKGQRKLTPVAAQRSLLDLIGKFKWRMYDYKAERQRD